METGLIPDVVESPSTRRGLISNAAAACAAAFAYLATKGTEQAFSLYSWRCCQLALGPPFCPSIGSCPSGYFFRVWYCCQAGSLYGCQECTKASSCFVGPFKCSRGYGPIPGPCP